MKLIGVTQRVEFIKEYNEKRDALDQMWTKLLNHCGFIPIILPNDIVAIKNILKATNIEGILLTGGNNLTKHGGDSPERDESERFCIEYCIENDLPVFGVCRGMQMIQDYFGVTLNKVNGHVQKKQTILFYQNEVEVNSYHNFGAYETVEELIVTGKSVDGVIKSTKHKDYKISGIMWHPERIIPFDERDVKLLKDFYKHKYT